MLVNVFIAFARHFASISGNSANVVKAVKQSLEACPAPKQVEDLALRILPSLKTEMHPMEAVAGCKTCKIEPSTASGNTTQLGDSQ